ncbi:MAG: PAS domain S-box protein [Verrucomicrobiota bacterium]
MGLTSGSLLRTCLTIVKKNLFALTTVLLFCLGTILPVLGWIAGLNIPYPLLAALSLLQILLVGRWVSALRATRNRIGTLFMATEEFAKGTWQPLALTGSDELGQLAATFNSMAERLYDYTSRLEDANRRMKAEITERTFIEEALRNSERRFRSIWENSIDAMRLTDSKGVIIAANPAYARLVARSLDELIESPFTISHDPATAAITLEQYRSAFAKRDFNSTVCKKIQRPDGRNLHLEVTFSFIDLERPLLLAIFRDVTERFAATENLRKAKEFSENLIKTANVMIIGLDQRDCIHIFNQTAEAISGYTREAVAGKSWKEFTGSEMVRAESASHSTQFDATFKSASGEERSISWQCNAILDGSTRVGTICFGIDITDKKRQEEQRLTLERKLLDAQKLESLGVLAGGIAHDFNNLLTAILGNASLANLHTREDSKLRGYLTNVEKTSLRAAELCKQMLAYSGKAQFVIKSLDLNEVVNETAELLEVSISKNAGLRIELRPKLPRVAGDPTQIRQVVMNLVINASEAIGNQPGQIRVKTGVITADANYFDQAYMAVEPTPGEYVYVQVIDTGCGMSQETQARIFDPFFTTKFTGRGLGLAAVLGIVRAHRGALKIQSEPGKGSTFTFLLPVALREEPRPAVLRAPVPEKWTGKGTVLVVDDDPNVRAVTSRMVEASGFEVLQAVDGRHAVEVFREKKESISAVVLDLTMPNLNGDEAFEQMQEIQPDVKVLLVSGFSESSKSSLLINKGLSAFLQKPFKPEELKQQLRSMLAPR